MNLPGTIPFGATARRPAWTDLPGPVRREIEVLAGGTVESAVSQGSGYTPGFASRLQLNNGQRVFVKAASSEHPWMIEAYQAEADKLRLLPVEVPAPDVIFERHCRVDDRDWLIIGFTDIDGRPPDRPWREDQATAVLDTVASTSRALTPPPNGFEWLGLDAEFGANEAKWQTVVDQRLAPEPLIKIGPALARNFLARHPRTTLVHCDLRDDNVIIGSDVWICDWNFPVVGPRWIDAVSLLISVHGDGLDADRMLAWTGLVPDDERELVDGFLATLLAYFAIASRRPEVDNSPYLRTHQRWYEAATADWLLKRTR